MTQQLALDIDGQPDVLADERADVVPVVLHLRRWLGEQGIRECRCSYFLAATDYEAWWATQREGERAGYVRTGTDAACLHHGHVLSAADRSDQ